MFGHIEVHGCYVKCHSTIATFTQYSVVLWNGKVLVVQEFRWHRIARTFRYFYLSEETTQTFKLVLIPNLLETVGISDQCLLLGIGKIASHLSSPLHFLHLFLLFLCFRAQPSRPRKLMCDIEILSHACCSQLVFKLPNGIRCLTTCLENKLGSSTRIKIDSQTCNLKPSRELNDTLIKIEKNSCFVAEYILCPLLIAPAV